MADDWKRQLNNRLGEKRDVVSVMKSLNSEEGLSALGIDPSAKDKAMKYVQQLSKRINAIRKVDSMQEDEYRLLDEAKSYLSDSIKYPVSVELESKSSSQRAANAMPLRPSIDILS